jgi:hypothetical protein
MLPDNIMIAADNMLSDNSKLSDNIILSDHMLSADNIVLSVNIEADKLCYMIACHLINCYRIT